MRILFSSYAFYPSVGGLESVSWILAHQFVAFGHELWVITQTPADPSSSYTDQDFPFPILRQPDRHQLFESLHWCEVAFHNNISLSLAWPLLWIRRPWVIAHHTWITSTEGQFRWQDQLKLALLRFADNISISRAIADHLSLPSTVIPNPYREELFGILPDVNRDQDLIFLGRLVSDKGADILLDALGRLRQQDLIPNLTVIGQGPEGNSLRQQAEQLGISDQVSFLGRRTGEELVQILNQHRIMVVPSRWPEPFGVVALEGIACGCVIVGSNRGGLPDAIGSCGLTFANGDSMALAQILEDLLLNPEQLTRFRLEANQHLAQHRQERIARQYLGVIESASGG